MEFKIKWAEQKTSSTGKTYSVLDLEGVEGKVSIWPDHPEYKDLRNGGTIKGEIIKKGNFTNLAPENAVAGQFRGNKGVLMEKVMEKKEASIEKFQNSKEESIKIASTMSGAVNLAVAELTQKQGMTTEDIEAMVRRWRKFLWFEWEKVNEYPPFN